MRGELSCTSIKLQEYKAEQTVCCRVQTVAATVSKKDGSGSRNNPAVTENKTLTVQSRGHSLGITKEVLQERQPIYRYQPTDIKSLT